MHTRVYLSKLCKSEGPSEGVIEHRLVEDTVLIAASLRCVALWLSMVS